MIDDETEANDEIGARQLCASCIGEEYLHAEIEKQGKAGKCDYCGHSGPTNTIAELADRISSVIDEHFERTPTEPSYLELSMEEDWERSGSPIAEVIGEIAQIEPEPAEDIRQVLDEATANYGKDYIGEENPFDEDAHYTPGSIDDSELVHSWDDFENSLKTEARYFNPIAEELLTRVFEGIADHKDFKGKSAIVKFGPTTKRSALFRARAFQSSRKLKEALKYPDRELGAPPSRYASAGRMNAHGISVFYGSTTPQLALREVRPPVGSRVIVGRFEVIRKLRVLDVNALKRLYVDGSYFDPQYGNRLARVKFLERLAERITRPIMPNDEVSEYLITQVIAEYLANHIATAIDGILYSSVQAPRRGANVVLFHKAAVVEPYELPAGTEIEVDLGLFTEEGWEDDYSVWEETPTKEDNDQIAAERPCVPLPSGLQLDTGFDGREPTLRLDVSHITVHHVRAANYQTAPFVVRRHRSQKRADPF